ncbi:TapB family protein [Maribacter antarcticus]
MAKLAGTFDCFLITKTSISKIMGATHTTTNKLWLAEGIGMLNKNRTKKR